MAHHNPAARCPKRKQEIIAYLKKHATQYTAEEHAQKLEISETSVRRWCKSFNCGIPKPNIPPKRGFAFKGRELKKRESAISFLREHSSEYTYDELRDILEYTQPILRYICQTNDFPLPKYKSASHKGSDLLQKNQQITAKPNMRLTINRILSSPLI